MDEHQNLKYDVLLKSRVWMIHQNLEYDLSSKSRIWMNIKIKSLDFYPDLSMIFHSKLGYG